MLEALTLVRMSVCTEALTLIAAKHQKYSEQQNCSTKGQFSLVSQIVAQRTKEKLWEIYKTKVDILSFVTPNYRSSVPVIDLI